LSELTCFRQLESSDAWNSGWRGLGAQVVAGGGSCASSARVCSGTKNGETAHESVIDGHESARVIELAAVVWCTKHCHQLATTEELVAILDDLMGSTDQVDIIFLQELLDNGLAESVGYATVILTPA